MAKALTTVQLDDAHQYSSNHEAQIKSSEKCGCFYCRKIFPPDKIIDWMDETAGGRTAMCPYCGIDAVIGSSSPYSISREFLSQMHWYFFK